MANMTIPMDPNTAAFYAGAAAGSKASEELNAPESRERPFEERSGYFWLRVGMLFAESGLQGQDLLGTFVTGATQRKPERKGFFLHIDTDGDAFHSRDPEAEDFDVYQDDEDRNREVARILQRLVRDVEAGAETGTLLDANGHAVGAFETNDS